MKDRLSKYPGRVKLTPVAGQADTFDMIRADEPENEGTPLNKNSLLKDETAEAIGLDPASDPTPDDAFGKLAEKCDLKAGDITETLRTDLGDNWVLCNGDIVPEGAYPELREVLPYNTEWRTVPAENAGLSKGANFRPLPVSGQWYYMNVYIGSGSSTGQIAAVYDANTDTITEISCPTVSAAVKKYGMFGLTHDGDRYILGVAEMQTSDSMTGITHFFASTNLEDWEEVASFNARTNSYFACDLYFDGTYLMVIEKSSQYSAYVVYFDKGLTKRTELTSIGTSAYKFVPLPAGYWSYATSSDKYVQVFGTGSKTQKFGFSSSNNLSRVAFFNDRYWVGLPVSGDTCRQTEIVDITDNSKVSIYANNMINYGRYEYGYLKGAEYDRTSNEWAFYIEYIDTSSTSRWVAYISADADPTNAANYRATRISTIPTTLSSEQMKSDRSQMGLSSDSYRTLRDPNLKFLPEHDGDTYKYIYAGGAEE